MSTRKRRTYTVLRNPTPEARQARRQAGDTREAARRDQEAQKAAQRRSQPRQALHAWLLDQTGRDDATGALARDYSAALALNLHPQVSTPDKLRRIVARHTFHRASLDDVEQAIAEWTEARA